MTVFFQRQAEGLSHLALWIDCRPDVSIRYTLRESDGLQILDLERKFKMFETNSDKLSTTSSSGLSRSTPLCAMGEETLLFGTLIMIMQYTIGLSQPPMKPSTSTSLTFRTQMPYRPSKRSSMIFRSRY